MSLETICELLEEMFEEDSDKWITSNEIASMLGISHAAVCVTMKKLRRRGEVLFEQLGKKGYIYKFGEA